jgi:hypothetical protein
MWRHSAIASLATWLLVGAFVSTSQSITAPCPQEDRWRKYRAPEKPFDVQPAPSQTQALERLKATYPIDPHGTQNGDRFI